MYIYLYVFVSVFSNKSLASFPGSLSPFLIFRVLECCTWKFKERREPGMKPRPPVATLANHGHGHGGHAFHCSLYCSHTILWIKTTSPVDHKDCSMDHFITKWYNFTEVWYKVANQDGSHGKTYLQNRYMYKSKAFVAHQVSLWPISNLVMIHKAVWERYSEQPNVWPPWPCPGWPRWPQVGGVPYQSLLLLQFLHIIFVHMKKWEQERESWFIYLTPIYKYGADI